MRTLPVGTVPDDILDRRAVGVRGDPDIGVDPVEESLQLVELLGADDQELFFA